MLEQSIRKKNIDSLTGIRILAAGYVLFYHVGIFFLKPFFPDIFYYYNFIFAGGWMGVDLFFLLSGFIISYNYFDEFEKVKLSKYTDFLVKRLARIYPVHVSCLAILFLSFFLSSYEGLWSTSGVVLGDGMPVNLTVEGLIESLLLIHAWDIPFVSYAEATWVAASWSVSCEWLAYILFPLVVILLSPFKNRVSLYIALGIIYLLTLTMFVLLMVEKQPLLASTTLVRIFFGFTAGVILYKLFALNPISEAQSICWKDKLVIAIAVFASCFSWLYFSYGWMMIIFAWLIFSIAQDRIKIKWLSSASFIYGGKVSYSLYMVHGTTLILYHVFVHPHDYLGEGVIFKVFYILSYLVITTGLSIFCYHFVEEPSRRLIVKRWLATNRNSSISR